MYNKIAKGGVLMDINERIQKLRKVLKLSQMAFGEKMFLSRDVISNIEGKRVVPKESILKNICTTYNVNPDWLINGTGEMFSETSDGFVERIKNEYDLDDLDVMITKRYLELSKEEKQNFRSILLKLVNGQVDINQLPEPQMTAEEAEAEYIKKMYGDAACKEFTAYSSIKNTDVEKTSD